MVMQIAQCLRILMIALPESVTDQLRALTQSI